MEEALKRRQRKQKRFWKDEYGKIRYGDQPQQEQEGELKIDFTPEKEEFENIFKKIASKYWPVRKGGEFFPSENRHPILCQWFNYRNNRYRFNMQKFHLKDTGTTMFFVYDEIDGYAHIPKEVIPLIRDKRASNKAMLKVLVELMRAAEYTEFEEINL